MISNKTRNFLFPCLKRHGSAFASMIVKDMHKQQVGIGDIVYSKTKGNIDFPCLFFLIDTSVQTGKFASALEKMKQEDYYVTDYVFDNINDGYLHMVVIKFPDENKDSFLKFINGEYSKMYSEEDIKEFFEGELKSEEAKLQRSYIISVLKRDPELKSSFMNFLNERFNTTVTELDKDCEYSLKPEFDEEFFNHIYNNYYGC